MRKTNVQFPAPVRREDGFTLIELLIVILIVGILTAIAVPTFLGQRTKANDACAKAMTKEMFTATKAYQTEHNTLAGLTIDDLHENESSIVTSSSGANSCFAIGVGYGPSSGSCDTGSTPGVVNFCVSARSTTGTEFTLAELDGGRIFRGCAVASGEQTPLGGCRGTGTTDGTW